MVRIHSLCLALVACRAVRGDLLAGDCDDGQACDQDTSSLLQHKVQERHLRDQALSTEGFHRRHRGGPDDHGLMNPHEGSNSSTCAGGPNPSVDHCPQHECYGRSTCCCGSGRCKDKPRDICVQVNECNDPPCGTVSIPGFPVAVKEMLPAYHPSYISDGCTCPGVQGCDPTDANTVCWGQMTCDMSLLSKCRRTGYCFGLLNTQAIVGSFCITDGSPKEFTFCSAKFTPMTRRRRSFCRRRRHGRRHGHLLMQEPAGDDAEAAGSDGEAASGADEVEYGPDYGGQRAREMQPGN